MKRKQLAHRTSIPHKYFVDEDLYCGEHFAPVDISASVAGSIFVIALITGSAAVIICAVTLIAKCIRGILAMLA